MADLSVANPLSIAAVASSSKLAVVASGSTLVVQDGSTAQFIAGTSSSQADPIPLVRHTAISADEAYIATASDDKLLRVYSQADGSYTLLSTRSTSKKCSELSFAPGSSEPGIIYSDKVGDVYLYPLTPREVVGERPAPLALQSDPTLNPDADLLLGHVSVLTASVLSYCGKYIITSDRDEHIRVSRFPKAHNIERYLFGTDGFVSALHIPESDPATLISAGGEQWMRVWNWQTGEALGKVDVYQAVLPHRRARTALRRVKRKRNDPQREAGTEPAKEQESEMEAGSFYSAPEGYALPSGQGVCIKKIRTVKVGVETMVVFFSEGAAAIHSFPLSLSSEPTITTCPLDFPILDFTFLPSSPSSPQMLISLDTTWGILKRNAVPGSQSTEITPPSITPECQAKMENVLVVAELSSDGIKLISDHPLIASLQSELVTAPASSVAKLQLYPLLPLLPRWAGMEEDDELAGPSAAPDASGGGEGDAAADRLVDVEGAENKVWTREELSKMSNKALGRLKSKGVDVDEYLKRKPRGARGAAKKRKMEGGAAVEEGEGDVSVDIEEQLNA